MLHQSDTCYWNLSSTGEFSVSTAYKSFQDILDGEGEHHWSFLWKWPGIQRARVFLWLAYKQRLLTNAERTRRHMTTSSCCITCGAEFEDVDHILRHCTVAQACWSRLVPQDRMRDFYSKPFPQWFMWNLNPRCMGTHWRLYFGTLCWKLWDNRNKSIFTNASLSPEEIILFVTSFVNHMVNVNGFLLTLI